MKQKDYYAILNVTRDASENEIRKTYRQLVLKYNPDKNPDDNTVITKFREITEAYELLKDTVERKRYDQLNPPEPGRNLEYHLEVSLKNITDDKQGSIEEVTFEVKGKKIKLTLDKDNITQRLCGAGEIGVYGGDPGDLLVVVNAKQQLSMTILGNDDAEMMLIPEGEFLMGSDGEGAQDNEKPVHLVYLDAFYMDKFPVTNAQYKAFVDANPEWSKEGLSPKYLSESYLYGWDRNIFPSGKANHPIVSVSWYAAMAYAKWAGKRLPTEAEWEKAARGGLVVQKYPWGNSIDSSNANYDKKVWDTTPVSSYPANNYGLCDMVGNVNEWCLDGYDANFYGRSPHKNPILHENKTQKTENITFTNCRVHRGGSWIDSAQGVRVACRRWQQASIQVPWTGFRCAKSITF